MSEDPTGPGRADDSTASPDTGSGHNTDVGGSHSGGDGGDEQHRAFGSATPGGGDNPFSADEAGEELDETSPSEGTPEDLKPGGARPGIDEESGAPGGDDARETSA